MAWKKLVRKSTHSLTEIESILKDIVLTNLDTPKKPKKNNKVVAGEALKVVIGGENIYALSDRYKTFFSKGCSCCVCGAKGDHWVLLKNEGDNQYHLNLYAKTSDGTIVLMTKDHIIPKSKGGKSHLSNYQPMCEECNKKKGANHE